MKKHLMYYESFKFLSASFSSAKFKKNIRFTNNIHRIFSFLEMSVSISPSFLFSLFPDLCKYQRVAAKMITK